MASAHLLTSKMLVNMFRLVPFINSVNVYGLPEQADSHKLKSTRETEPYSLLNKDVFYHEITNSKQGLYASVPFIMNEKSLGLLRQSSSETYVDFWPMRHRNIEGAFF